MDASQGEAGRRSGAARLVLVLGLLVLGLVRLVAAAAALAAPAALMTLVL